MAVCGAYAIRPYPDRRKFIRFWVRFYPMQKKIAIFSGIRVGRNSIRPTDDYGSGRMSGKTGVFLVRFYPMQKKIAIFPGICVGRNSIRPTDDHGSGRVNEKRGEVFTIQVGCKGIRPTDDHTGGQADEKPTENRVRISRRGGKGGGAWVVRKAGQARFHNYTATVTFAGASQDGTNHRFRSRIHNP